ncbi:MAG: HigA family addiction module antidote protein [Rhodospirillaceae bacterium]|nr:HigA family addiction module antidote protein [Rhodospirillaceae bacterium]
MSNIEPIHPGEHLAEFLEELGISQYRLATAIRVPPRRINEIVHGRRGVTADTALRVRKALGTSPEFWLNLQRMYDLDVARNSTDVEDIQPLVTAA